MASVPTSVLPPPPPVWDARPAGQPTVSLWRLLDPRRGLHHRRHPPGSLRHAASPDRLLGDRTSQPTGHHYRSAANVVSLVIGWLYFALLESSRARRHRRQDG